MCGDLNALTKRLVLAFHRDSYEFLFPLSPLNEMLMACSGVLMHEFYHWVISLSLLLIQSLARMNKKDSWLFWWTLYLAVSKDLIITY